MNYTHMLETFKNLKNNKIDFSHLIIYIKIISL